MAACAAAILSSGCQATAVIGVDSTGGGRGTVQASVTLDREAADRLAHFGGAKLDGLRRAGWVVTGPTAGTGGTTVFSATNEYTTPEQAAVEVGELSGANGPLQNFRIRQRRTLFETVTSFTGTVDLQQGTNSQGTAALGAAGTALGVDVTALGVDVTALNHQLSTDLNRLFRIRVSVRLPGQLTSSNSPAPASNGASWQPQFGELAELSASSRDRNTAHLVVAIALGVLVLVASGVGGGIFVRRRRARDHAR